MAEEEKSGEPVKEKNELQMLTVIYFNNIRLIFKSTKCLSLIVWLTSRDLSVFSCVCISIC